MMKPFKLFQGAIRAVRDRFDSSPRRNGICLLGAALALVLAFVVSPSPVDRGFKNANLRGLRTEAEVVAILGPPGDYSTKKWEYYFNQALVPLSTGRGMEWKDDYAIVVVYFPKDLTSWYWNVGKVPKSVDGLDCLRDFFLGPIPERGNALRSSQRLQNPLELGGFSELTSTSPVDR